jgi:hypothetical protein
MTFGSIATHIGHTMISLSTCHSCPSLSALTLEVLQRVLELTFAVIKTGIGVANGGQLDLTKRGRESQFAETLELRTSVTTAVGSCGQTCAAIETPVGPKARVLRLTAGAHKLLRTSTEGMS